MAYTPQLSYENSCVLRRIAWWLGKPMTYAIAWVIGQSVKHIDAESVCSACKAPMKCDSCPFRSGRH